MQIIVIKPYSISIEEIFDIANTLKKNFSIQTLYLILNKESVSNVEFTQLNSYFGKENILYFEKDLFKKIKFLKSLRKKIFDIGVGITCGEKRCSSNMLLLFLLKVKRKIILDKERFSIEDVNKLQLFWASCQEILSKIYLFIKKIIKKIIKILLSVIISPLLLFTLFFLIFLTFFLKIGRRLWKWDKKIC